MITTRHLNMIQFPNFGWLVNFISNNGFQPTMIDTTHICFTILLRKHSKTEAEDDAPVVFDHEPGMLRRHQHGRRRVSAREREVVERALA